MTNTNYDKHPMLGEHATVGQLGEARIEVAVLELGQIYRRQGELDFGVDGVIELVTEGSIGKATGRQVGVQVKSGISVVKPTRYGRTLYCTEQHANYWIGHSLPIVVVHSEPGSGRIRWQHVNRETMRRTSHGFAIDLPEDSELRTSLAALRSLAHHIPSVSPEPEATFIIPYDPEHGITASDDDLGLAALEFSRALIRGATGSLRIDVAGEADLVAGIDAIADMAAPSREDRHDAVIRRDILDRLQKHVSRIRRKIALMLTDKSMADSMGYQADWLAGAVREAARPLYGLDLRSRDQHLKAWPDYRTRQPDVSFQVPDHAMTAFYDREPSNREIIRAEHSGITVSELAPDIVATRFLPALAEKIIRLSDVEGSDERKVIERLPQPFNCWYFGIS